MKLRGCLGEEALGTVMGTPCRGSTVACSGLWAAPDTVRSRMARVAVRGSEP